MISSAQLRAARALLRWSAKDLAERSGVGVATIHRMESDEGVPASGARTLSALETALVAGGVEFVGSASDRPGVRLLFDSEVGQPKPRGIRKK